MTHVGGIIWAKLRGYPWWPAEIVKYEQLPKAIKSTDKDLTPVFFFGSRDYALISNENIKDFNAENWKLFKGKSSAPKFKLAVSEAKKKANVSVAETTDPTMKSDGSGKKRGRPRKLKLTESRKRLQQLLFSDDISCKPEVIMILTTINNVNELDKEECKSSKIGNLLKKVICSSEKNIWQKDEELLKLIQRVAIKIINSK